MWRLYTVKEEVSVTFPSVQYMVNDDLCGVPSVRYTVKDDLCGVPSVRYLGARCDHGEVMTFVVLLSDELIILLHLCSVNS